MKRCLWIALLASATALAQQATIPGSQLLSGQADAKLQQAAKDAKAGNKKLVISAPQHWHDLILEQLRKGGGGDVKVEMHDSFTESVMLRADAQAAAEPAAPAAPATPAAAPAPAAKPAPAPAPAKPVTVPPPTPAAKPTPPPPAPTPVAPPASAPKEKPAPAAAPPSPVPPPAAAPTPTPQPAPTAVPPPPPPAAAVPAAPPTPAAPTKQESSGAAEVDSIRKRLEQNLNAGEPAAGTIVPSKLETGDLVYAQGPVRAVVHRGGVRNTLYWLEGEVNLERVEFKDLGGDRYQVVEPLRSGTPILRSKTEAPAVFAAGEPASAPDERKTLESRYNSGKPITATLRPGDLKLRDLIYVGDKLAVVVRLSGLDIERYYLVGQINLARSQLSKDGANKYRVLSDLKD